MYVLILLFDVVFLYYLSYMYDIVVITVYVYYYILSNIGIYIEIYFNYLQYSNIRFVYILTLFQIFSHHSFPCFVPSGKRKNRLLHCNARRPLQMGFYWFSF